MYQLKPLETIGNYSVSGVEGIPELIVVSTTKNTVLYDDPLADIVSSEKYSQNDVILDVGSVRLLNSSGLAGIVKALKRVRNRKDGSTNYFAICNAGEKPQSLLRITKLELVVPHADTDLEFAIMLYEKEKGLHIEESEQQH